MPRDHARLQTSIVPRYHDGTIKRLAIPAAVRRAVALAAGAVPGTTTPVACHYCGEPGEAYWPMLYKAKRPGSWVAFSNLSLDHVVAYSKGGNHRDPANYVLACKPCNSSKSDHDLADWAGRRR